METVIAGYQRKNAVISPEERKIVSYHEIGHALVAAKQTNSAPVTKITIIPRTSGALGYTMQVDEGEHFLMSQDGNRKQNRHPHRRSAQRKQLIFGSITTGASNDIEQATKLARAMVTRYGMSEEFGMVALETINNQYLGGDASLACAQATAAKIDRAGGGHRENRPGEGRPISSGKTRASSISWPRSCWKRRPSPARNSWTF